MLIEDCAEKETETRLNAEEQRLEALYQQQAEKLESLQADREAELRETLGRELAEQRAMLVPVSLTSASFCVCVCGVNMAEVRARSLARAEDRKLRAMLLRRLRANSTSLSDEMLTR